MVQLEEEIAALKARVNQLETTIQHMIETESNVRSQPFGGPLTPHELRDLLKNEGIIVDLSTHVRAYAEHWRSLPEEEKQEILTELDHLPIGPLASDIVIDNRY